jgi:hypothetical protein
MKECICCQCREDFSRVEYFQCEGCQLYGTIDDFPSHGNEMCWTCTEREQGASEQAVELERERSAFTMTVLRGGK